LPCKLPIVEQFLPVQLGPFKDEPKRPVRELPVNRTRLDFDRDFVLSIHRMEVRHPMLVEEHADDDAKKPGDLGHAFSGLTRRQSPGQLRIYRIEQPLLDKRLPLS
jgi:hypothetical protein